MKPEWQRVIKLNNSTLKGMVKMNKRQISLIIILTLVILTMFVPVSANIIYDSQRDEYTFDGQADANSWVPILITYGEKTAADIYPPNSEEPINVVASIEQVKADYNGNFSSLLRFKEFGIPSVSVYTIAIGRPEDSFYKKVAYHYFSSSQKAEAETFIVAEIKAANSIAELEQLIGLYGAPILSLNNYSTYSTFLGNIDGLFTIKNTLNTSAQIVNEFNNSVVMEKLKKASGWGVIDSIVLLHKDVIGYDEAKYSTVQTAAAKEIMRRLDSTMTVSDIPPIIEECYDNRNRGAGGGGGGGRSATIYSNVSGLFNADNLPKNDNNNKPLLADTDTVLFNDIDNVLWAKDSINDLVKRGVINGRENGIFAPYDNITREEFVKLIIEGLGIEKITGKSYFNDVKENQWYYPYIETAKAYSLISGIDDITFGIGMNLTRQDMAVIIYRAALISSITMTASEAAEGFTDEEDIATYALSPIMALKSSGIVGGMGDERFAPLELVNRAQAAVIIQRMMQKKVIKPTVPTVQDEPVVTTPLGSRTIVPIEKNTIIDPTTDAKSENKEETAVSKSAKNE